MNNYIWRLDGDALSLYDSVFQKSSKYDNHLVKLKMFEINILTYLLVMITELLQILKLILTASEINLKGLESIEQFQIC